MKTSMAYRMFRSYFNDHSDDYALFGNRVHNPINGNTKPESTYSAALIRSFLIAVALGALIAIASL